VIRPNQGGHGRSRALPPAGVDILRVLSALQRGMKVLMSQLEMTLATSPTAPGSARQAVRTWFHSRSCGDDATATAALLVTELVSNAVVHAKGPSLWVSVEETTTDVLHVTVRDGSSQGIPRDCAQAPDVHQTGGRGLFMVDALSTRWGWEPLDTGKIVWFELPCVTISPS
jgi:anti-sigma regulatory factor (Ser/Thr protein kinase)